MSPWALAVTNQYPCLYDLKSCQDVKLQQPTNYVHENVDNIGEFLYRVGFGRRWLSQSRHLVELIGTILSKIQLE